MVVRIIEVLGIRNGPVYFQIRLTADRGPKILEITPRLDGCHVWRIIKMVYGVDLLDASFKWLMGYRQLDLQVRMNMGRHRKMFFLCPTGAEFHKADYPLPEGAFLPDYYYHEGETVLPVHGKMEKVVYYFEKE
jgi:biotin carboxylase